MIARRAAAFAAAVLLAVGVAGPAAAAPEPPPVPAAGTCLWVVVQPFVPGYDAVALRCRGPIAFTYRLKCYLNGTLVYQGDVQGPVRLAADTPVWSQLFVCTLPRLAGVSWSQLWDV